MNLKHLRTAHKKTQKEIAEFLKINQVTYGRYELGTSEPNLDTLIKLANYYDVSLDYLCARQYNNQIGYIPDNRREIVKNLLKLNDQQAERVNGFILGILEK